MTYIYDRLKEASTWRGVMAFLTGIGVVLSPDQIEAIVAGGLSVIGLIGVFSNDGPAK